MKLNNKGFAITAVIYGLLILFVVLVSSYLTVLSARKNRVDNLVKDIETLYMDNYYSNIDNNNSNEHNGENIPSDITLFEVHLMGLGSDPINHTVIYFSPVNRLWYSDFNGDEAITNIIPPVLNNYSFRGYYTQMNGLGEQIINNSGRIISNNISENTELYSFFVRDSGLDVLE